MATLTTKTDDAGKPISYKFTCCVGRDDSGKQIWRTKTIKSPGLTPKREKDYVADQMAAWEKQQKADYARTHNAVDKDRITLAEFVTEHWWPDHVMDGSHTPSSISFYKQMSDHILEYFGSKKKLSQIDAEAVKRYRNRASLIVLPLFSTIFLHCVTSWSMQGVSITSSLTLATI